VECDDEWWEPLACDGLLEAWAVLRCDEEDRLDEEE
jgi:hypothetical protein